MYWGTEIHSIFKAYSLITILISSVLLILLPAKSFGDIVETINEDSTEVTDESVSDTAINVDEEDQVLDESAPLLPGADISNHTTHSSSKPMLEHRKDPDLSHLLLLEQISSPFFM